MYKRIKQPKSRLKINNSFEGEPLEMAITRMINNGDEKMQTKDIIYTRPEDGIPAATDVRTDKWLEGIKNTEEVTNKVRNDKETQLENRKKALEEANEKARKRQEWIDSQMKGSTDGTD